MEEDRSWDTENVLAAQGNNPIIIIVIVGTSDGSGIKEHRAYLLVTVLRGKIVPNLCNYVPS